MLQNLSVLQRMSKYTNIRVCVCRRKGVQYEEQRQHFIHSDAGTAGCRRCSYVCVCVLPDLLILQLLCFAGNIHGIRGGWAVVSQGPRHRAGEHCCIHSSHACDEYSCTAVGTSDAAQPVCVVLPCAKVVIGAHGKLKAWSTKRILSFDSIQILVYDEADEMLNNDGFGDDSVRLVKAIRKCNPQVRRII